MTATQVFIQCCQDYYQKATNCPGTPFVDVLHDAWSKTLSDEVLGVSITFIDPLSYIFFWAAVGLQDIEDKDLHLMANDCAKQNGL
jgi:hypothetical protein